MCSSATGIRSRSTELVTMGVLAGHYRNILGAIAAYY